MAGPCPFGLASAKVPAKRWRTRAELLLILEEARSLLLKGSDAGLSDLAAEVGVSPHHLQRLFKAAYGESPKAFQLRRRAEQAAEMLRAGAKPIEVIVSLRYSEASAFSRDFKRHHGVSPRVFCKKCQPAASNETQNSKTL